MASRRSTAPGNDDLRTLWAVGAIGGADDATLVARYAATRDDAAFRVLVERHGPMVLRVCRQLLHDGHDAEEAAQAVFLVLARKAGSLRVKGTAAAWLYGVSRRVAARARVRASARQARERRTALVVACPDGGETDGPDDWSAVHEEIGRLPEKYRMPVVLCYLEGRSYEQTAARLGCPVGTVRVRLSRARDKLRDRLTRRGFGPERVATLGLIGETTVKTATAPTAWVEATVIATRAYATARASTAAGLVPAAAWVLSDEVLGGFTMSTWKILTGVALGLVLTTGGAWGFMAATGGQGGPTPPVVKGGAGSPPPESPTRTVESRVNPDNTPAESVDVLLARETEEVLKLVRERVEAQRAFYEEGRITIDRYIQALKLLKDAEADHARTRDERLLASKRFMLAVGEIVEREESELKVGRNTIADVTEARLAYHSAFVALLKEQKATGPDELTQLRKRVDALEQEIKALKNPTRVDGNGTKND